MVFGARHTAPVIAGPVRPAHAAPPPVNHITQFDPHGAADMKRRTYLLIAAAPVGAYLLIVAAGEACLLLTDPGPCLWLARLRFQVQSDVIWSGGGVGNWSMGGADVP